MAIVLEVSLTLNPGNQIAYLADDTGLVVGTEYVLAGTHIAADTRFTYNGNLDIVLTKQPIAVPTNNFVTPVSINTVPTAAPAPPVATYPYSVKNQLAASGLNHDLEFSPGPLPPQSALGGAGRFKYWIDTSTPLPTLRQCVVSRASTTYVATDWAILGTVDAANHKFHFDSGSVDFSGGAPGSVLNVTNITVTGATNLTTLNVTGGSTLSTLNVSGASTLTTLNVTGAARLPTITGPTTINGTTTINGAETVTGGMTVSGGIHYTGVAGGNGISFGWDGNIENYVDGTYIGATVMRITAGNGLSGGGGPSGGTVTLAMSGSFTGNFNVSGQSYGGTLYSGGAIYAAGTVTAAGNVSASGAVTAGGYGSNVAGLVINSGGGSEALAMMGGDIGLHNGVCILPNAPNQSGVGLAGFAFQLMYAYTYVTASDRRDKADIETVEPGSIELVQKIAPRTYRIPGGADPQARHWGFIAQEVGEVMRAVDGFGGHVIGDDKNRSEGLAYNELVAVLWGAVREMAERLEALEGAR